MSEQELDLTNSEVVTEYKEAAEIVNKGLQLVLPECKPKAKIVDLCEKADSFIREQTGKMYKKVKKKIERGVAFPTSPLGGDETVLEDGDIVKIDMGCHIDGFIAVVAHTHVLQQGPVTGRAADVIAATNTAAEVALRLVRPGEKNKDVSEAIQNDAAAYDCKIVEGVLSHQMKQFVIDGNKVVLNSTGPDARVDDAKFEKNEVYASDIVTSTSEGKPKTDKPAKSIPPYMKAVSGSFGGVVEACCLQPIDVIKTRLQLDRTATYKGIVHCGTTIVQTEGVRALWKGLTPFASHLTLKYALRMGSNAVLQSAFKDSQTGEISHHGRFLSGFGAGVLEALVIVTPFEVVKIRLQQQRGLSPELFKYKGPIHCARMILREEGLRGLWSGASPTVMRNGTNQAAMFSAKNAFDGLLWSRHEGDGKVLLPWQSMISGFLAGTAGPVCTGPFDVVKTRLMAQNKSSGLKYRGMFHAIRTIYVEEGILALWKGLLPRLMRIPPGQAIMWGVADQITGFYESRYLNNAPLQ